MDMACRWPVISFSCELDDRYGFLWSTAIFMDAVWINCCFMDALWTINLMDVSMDALSGALGPIHEIILWMRP